MHVHAVLWRLYIGRRRLVASRRSIARSQGPYGVRRLSVCQTIEVEALTLPFLRLAFAYLSRPVQASADYDGRPRLNTIRDNRISSPLEGKGVAVKESDNDSIINNVFTGIDSLRFDNSTETLVSGNVLPDGVEFTLENGATLADGSQEPTD